MESEMSYLTRWKTGRLVALFVESWHHGQAMRKVAERKRRLVHKYDAKRELISEEWRIDNKERVTWEAEAKGARILADLDRERILDVLGELTVNRGLRWPSIRNGGEDVWSWSPADVESLTVWANPARYRQALDDETARGFDQAKAQREAGIYQRPTTTWSDDI